MNLKIPLNKIQSRQSINKIELTYIDNHLTTEQKKRIAKFYRDEAAKRTRYKIEPEWIMHESVQLVPVPEAEPSIENTPKAEEDVTEPATSSLPHTIITNDDETPHGNTEVLEIGTSPLNDQNFENSMHEPSSPEHYPIKGIVGKLLKRNQGSYSDLKKDVLTMKKFTKEFGEISNTKLKKLIYKGKMQQIKDLKRQHQQ